MRLWAMAIAASACGRLGFDPATDGGVSGDAVDALAGSPFRIEFFPTGLSDLRAVAALPDGGVVVVGGAVGPTAFGTTPLLSGGGGSDIVIAAVSSTGAVRWVKEYGGAGDDVAYAVASSADGTIYVTGMINGTVNLGGSNLIGDANDVFIASYTEAGDHRWSRSFGGDDQSTTYLTDVGLAIALAPDGDVVVAGSVAQDVNFGGGITLDAGSQNEAFVARYSPDGLASRWALRWGIAGTNFADDVAIDSSGAIYISGAYSGATNFGGGARANQGNQDAYVLALAGGGAYRWDATFGGGNNDRLYGIEVVGSTVIASGYYWDMINLPSIPRSSGLADGIVLGYDTATGVQRWATRYGGAGCDYISGSDAVDGTAAIVGTYADPLVLGGTSHQPAGGTDNLLFVADTGGGVPWSVGFGDASNEIAHGVTGSRATGVYVVGSKDRTWDGGCYSSTSVGFLSRL